jgi:hypothetical protein
MKTIKRGILRLQLVLVGLLAGAALTSAQSQMVVAGRGQGVVFDTTAANLAQVQFGNCSGSNCSMSGTGIIMNASGTAVSAGIWRLALNGGQPLIPSNSGAVARPPSGTFNFKGEVGTTGTITGSLAVTKTGGSQHPKTNITMTNLTATGSLAALYPPGSSADLGYTLNQFCTFQNVLSEAGFSWAWWSKLTPSAEPIAAFLLGSGLCVLSVLLRHRYKQTQRKSEFVFRNITTIPLRLPDSLPNEVGRAAVNSRSR